MSENSINDNKSQSTRLNNDQLWEKAASNQPITRRDIGLATSTNGNGLQSINEGLNTLKYNDQSGKVYIGSEE